MQKMLPFFIVTINSHIFCVKLKICKAYEFKVAWLWSSRVRWPLVNYFGNSPGGSRTLGILVFAPNLSMISISLQTIADDCRSGIADRKRLQRVLFPYNHKRSQCKALSHISVLGDYENYGLWAIL